MASDNLIEVAVSCLNDDVFRALNNIKEYSSSSTSTIFHIVHQVTNQLAYDEITTEIINLQGLKYSRLEEKGLPLSRNFALSNTKAKYLIPTDADVVLVANFEELVKNSFEKYQETDLISFQSFFDSDLSLPRKKFEPLPFKHTARSLLSVSSIEIVLKVDSFKSKNVSWDMDFGLGAYFPGGLETVMLNDAYRANLVCWYVPMPLSVHPEVSSGATINEKKVYVSSAVFVRLYGPLIGLLLSFAFYFKNSIYYKNLGISTVYKNILKGRKDFAFRKKSKK